MIKKCLIVACCSAAFAGCSRIADRQIATARNEVAREIVNSISGGAASSRQHARDLLAESETLRKSGDMNGAMEKRLQILKVRGGGPSQMNALVGYATQSLALDWLSSIASQLDAESSARYAKELRQIDASFPSYAVIMEHEKQNDLAELNRYSSKPKEWQSVLSLFKGQERAAVKALTPAQIKTNLIKLYDARIAAAKLPYSSKPIVVAVDPYTAYMTRDYGFRFIWTKSKTERLFAIMALERKTDHTLNRERQGTLPYDPFGTGPFKEKGGYVYSVGPDTVDNGGTPVPGRLQANSKGDYLMPLFSPRAHLKYQFNR